MKKAFIAIRGFFFRISHSPFLFIITVSLLFAGNIFLYNYSLELAVKKVPIEPVASIEAEVGQTSSPEAPKEPGIAVETETTINSNSTKKEPSTKKSNTLTGSPSTTPEALSATVAFYADSQSDTDGEDVNHQRVVNYILNTSASCVFHAGDLLEDGTQDSLNRFNAVTATLRSTRAFYSAPGNNERNSSIYFNNFSYPGNEHWFSVNRGNLHLVVLDNYASSVAVGSEQYNWLISDLSSSAAKTRIVAVMFHYPVSSGPLVSVFQNYGVDFVVSGHEHTYRRYQINGVQYFVMSGQPSIGYMTANIYSTRADFRVYNSNNSRIDTLTVNNR